MSDHRVIEPVVAIVAVNSDGDEYMLMHGPDPENILYGWDYYAFFNPSPGMFMATYDLDLDGELYCTRWEMIAPATLEGENGCAAGPWQSIETTPEDEEVLVLMRDGTVCFATYTIDDDGQDFWTYRHHIDKPIIAWAAINTQEEA